MTLTHCLQVTNLGDVSTKTLRIEGHALRNRTKTIVAIDGGHRHDKVGLPQYTKGELSNSTCLTTATYHPTFDFA